MLSRASRLLVAVVAVALATAATISAALDAPRFDLAFSSMVSSAGEPVHIPGRVMLGPFRAYEAAPPGEFREIGSTTLFQGSVVVPVRTYLAAVVLGEIDIASEVGSKALNAKGFATAPQQTAFETQARAALNELLARIARVTGTRPEESGGVFHQCKSR